MRLRQDLQRMPCGTSMGAQAHTCMCTGTMHGLPCTHSNNALG